MIVRADGSAEPIELTAGLDDFARFASPAGASMWIVMTSYRAVAGRTVPDVGQLWAMVFDSDRGAVSRPVYLPNQRADIAVLHAPIALP